MSRFSATSAAPPRVRRQRSQSLQCEPQQSLLDFARKQSRKARNGFAGSFKKTPGNDFETPEMLAKRRQLKHHPDVIAALDDWWLATDADGSGSIDCDEFTELLKAIYRVKVDADDEDDCQRTAAEEAREDFVGITTMDMARFQVAIFELADMYTETVDPQEYVVFLHLLLEELKSKGRLGAKEGRRTDDIASFDASHTHSLLAASQIGSSPNNHNRASVLDAVGRAPATESTTPATATMDGAQDAVDGAPTMNSTCAVGGVAVTDSTGAGGLLHVASESAIPRRRRRYSTSDIDMLKLPPIPSKQPGQFGLPGATTQPGAPAQPGTVYSDMHAEAAAVRQSRTLWNGSNLAVRVGAMHLDPAYVRLDSNIVGPMPWPTRKAASPGTPHVPGRGFSSARQNPKLTKLSEAALPEQLGDHTERQRAGFMGAARPRTPSGCAYVLPSRAVERPTKADLTAAAQLI